MRIELSDFPRLQVEGTIGEKDKKPATTFLDTLKEAVGAANEQASEANSSAVALARGESGNIHETMIAMEESSISFRMLAKVQNKVVDAYREVMRLQL